MPPKNIKEVMVVTHPLIETLLREIDDSKKLTGRQRSCFRSGVRKFSQSRSELGNQGLEKIYVIIRWWWEHYDSSQTNNEVNPLPYSGVMTEKGPEFDYESFPETLKRILCLFVCKHLELMESNPPPTSESES